jgi:hypothetical protein
MLGNTAALLQAYIFSDSMLPALGSCKDKIFHISTATCSYPQVALARVGGYFMQSHQRVHGLFPEQRRFRQRDRRICALTSALTR